MAKISKKEAQLAGTTMANMDADISFEDMQEGLNGLYEEGKVQG